jgi:hypothetical protein
VSIDPVTSAILHSSGTVVATCSGQRSSPSFQKDGSDSGEEDNEQSSESESESETSSRSSKEAHRTPDNSIKIWSL